VTDRFPQSLAACAQGGILSAAAAGARNFLLDPVDPVGEPVAAASDRRPAVAVFGLARGCGTTVVARALAAELAQRDSAGAALVACDAKRTALAPATPAAKRLARALADVPGHARAVGRLCLIGGVEPSRLAEDMRGVAPLVIDAGASLLGGVPACVSDRTVIVTTPALEPALARVASECVARVGREPILVLNRAGGGSESEPGGGGESEPVSLDDGAVRLPGSRMGAHFALGGREVRGYLGRAIAELADRCEQDL
jgi:hypothetical protein